MDRPLTPEELKILKTKACKHFMQPMEFRDGKIFYKTGTEHHRKYEVGYYGIADDDGCPYVSDVSGDFDLLIHRIK